MIVKEISSAAAWNDYLAQQNYPVVLQSYEWGKLKSNFGWEPFRLALYDQGKIIGGISLLKKTIPRTRGRSLFYAPRGPVLSEWSETALTHLIEAVRWLAEQEKVVFLRVDPAIPEDDEQRISLFSRLGFNLIKDDLQPRCTLVVDLNRSEDELLESFHQKQRYNIRLAKRKGVQISRVNTPEGIRRFYNLLEQTIERQKFLVHPQVYYEKIADIMASKGMADIFIASHDNEDLATAFTFKLGTRAWYMYGASSGQKRNLMPGHLLHWEIMQLYKQQGVTAYDLWGIPNNPKPGEPLWGVYRFKSGFNGDLVKLIGCYDLAFKPMLYRAMIQGWQAYRGMRNLATRGRWQGVYGD